LNKFESIFEQQSIKQAIKHFTSKKQHEQK